MKQPYKTNRRYGLTLFAAVFYFNVSAKVLPWRVLQKGSWCLFQFPDVADAIDEHDKIGMVEPFYAIENCQECFFWIVFGCLCLYETRKDYWAGKDNQVYPSRRMAE